MSSDVAIKVEGVSKAYRIWKEPSARLFAPAIRSIARAFPEDSGARRALTARAGRLYRDFYALKDISFEVRRGESVGIIGRNGSGKSTLLQIIAGTLTPTAGSVEVNGRVAALLELGSGFNPEFTGRENVFLNGAILGLTREEVEERFDAIAAFADIGEFIDQPVKTYSSGMMMRLAFAVNTCVDPDILIVDEALSVGDAPFQAKCFRRLRQLIDKGVSLLFVSHDIGTVRSICSRALWLKTGRPERWGDAKEVAREYEKFCWAEQGVVFDDDGEEIGVPVETSSIGATSTPTAVPDQEEKPLIPPTPPKSLFAPNPTLEKLAAESRYGNGNVAIVNLMLTDSNGDPISSIEYDQTLIVHYLLECRRPVDSEMIIGIRIKDIQGNFLISIQDIWNTHRLAAIQGSRFYARMEFPVRLTHGDFVLMTGIFGFADGNSRKGGVYDFGRAILWDVIEHAANFRVSQCKVFPLVGPIQHHAELVVHSIDPVAANSKPE